MPNGPTKARVASTGIAALLICACAGPPPADVAAGPDPVHPAEPKPSPAPGSVAAMPLEEFFVLQQSGDVLVYDVRPVFFHAMGHIPGAVNWPVSAYAKQLAAREAEIRAAARANRPVVMYCTDTACPDARNMAGWLATRGHHIRVLEGGWESWKTTGLSTS